jgi:hypothetical protein
MHDLCRRYFVPGIAWLMLISSPAFGTPVSTAPSGDLDGNGSVDVVDIQCQVLIFTHLILAQGCQIDADCTAVLGTGFVCRKGFTQTVLCLPNCLDNGVAVDQADAPPCPDSDADNDLCLGLVARNVADLNCDGFINNTDFNFLVQIVVGKLEGTDGADFDQDGKLNFCDDDSDGDGDPDITDCGLLNPLINSFNPEICDGKDNDCDGLVDGADDNILTPDCPLQLGVCTGATALPEACDNGAWLPCNAATYLAHNDAYEAIETSCDGLDNDCDGAADALDADLFQPECEKQAGVCAGAVKSATLCVASNYLPCQNSQYLAHSGHYQPVEDRCDGLDNDCDGAVDENWPELGSKCDGNDDDLCAHGTWICAGSGTGLFCDEFPSDLVEICGNNLDDDCDGATDETSALEPCQAYHPPVLDAPVQFTTDMGMPVGTEELGNGYYQSDIWNLTQLDSSAAIYGQIASILSPTWTVPVTSGPPAHLQLAVSRDELTADDSTLRVALFITDPDKRPTTPAGPVQVSIEGPSGTALATLSPMATGLYTGTWTPAGADFTGGGTLTLSAQTDDIQSGQATVDLLDYPVPTSLQLALGTVGLSLPLGPRLPGEVLAIPVSANTGIQTLASMNLDFNYDLQGLEFVSFAITNAGLNPASTADNGSGTITVATTRNVQSQPSLLTGTFELGVLQLKVADQAEAGSSAPVSGSVEELLDTSGNPIVQQVSMEMHDGTGQSTQGTIKVRPLESRALFAWLQDQLLADLSLVGLESETTSAKTYLLDNSGAPPSPADASCTCTNPGTCSCLNGTLHATGPGATMVLLSVDGRQENIPIEVHVAGQVHLTLSDPSLQQLAGWSGHYQATPYQITTDVAGPEGNTVLDITRLLELDIVAPQTASWDQDRFQIHGQAAGQTTVRALGPGGQELATATVEVTSASVAPQTLNLAIPALVEASRVLPTPVPANPGVTEARVRISSLFIADGQTAPILTTLTCADGHSFDITGDAGLDFSAESGDSVVTIMDQEVIAAGTGSETINGTWNPAGSQLATGTAAVEVALPDASHAIMMPASAKVALSLQDSAAVIAGYPTFVDVSPTVYYMDDSQADMTDDSRTVFEVVEGATLVAVCNTGDGPECPPGQVYTLSSETGLATVRAWWPGLYAEEIAAYAAIEVVAHNDLQLSTVENHSGATVDETVLSEIEGTGLYQSARIVMVQTFTDGTSLTVSSNPLSDYSMTDAQGAPLPGIVELQGTTVLALAPGEVLLQGHLNGNDSNAVELLVEGPGVDDGDGQSHIDIDNLMLKPAAPLVGVKGIATRNLTVEITFTDGTHAQAVTGGQVMLPGLVQFAVENSAVTNPADVAYATIEPDSGSVLLTGNGLVRAVASLVPQVDLGTPYDPGDPPVVAQANQLVLPTSHPGTRWIPCNCTPTPGDADIGAATGLPVPLSLDPGEEVELGIWINSGAKNLGAFSLEVAFSAELFEVPAPAGDHLQIDIPADAAAINDPAPGKVRITVVPASSTSLTGTTRVATVTLQARNSKSAGPVYTQLGGTILELYEKCALSECPAIDGAFGPTPRAINAGVVSIDPPGNLAEAGDFNGDGQFGVADLQAIVNYVTTPNSPEFAGFDLAAANIFPDHSDAGEPLVQAFDAYYGALISVGLSHFVDFNHGPAFGGGLNLEVEVRDGSSQPSPVVQNLQVQFEVGRLSGDSLAGLLACGENCSSSHDAQDVPVPERMLFTAEHQGSGIYRATIADWSALPAQTQIGITVILQNLLPDGSPKGAVKVYLRTPLENALSPFDPLATIVRCGTDGDCDGDEVCASGQCVVVGGDGSPCQAEIQCGEDLTCDPEAGTCVPSSQLGDTCLSSADCTTDLACVDGRCGTVLCTLSGNAGAQMDCPLHLARAQQEFLPATGIEFELGYAAQLATPVSLHRCGALSDPFTDYPCPTGTECEVFNNESITCDDATQTCRQCNDWAIDEIPMVLNSGHSVETCAQPPANCKDDRLKLLVWGTESLPITQAWWNNDTVNLESHLFTVRFVLDQPIPTSSAVALNPTGLVATDAKAKNLPVTVVFNGDGEAVLTTGESQ